MKRKAMMGIAIISSVIMSICSPTLCGGSDCLADKTAQVKTSSPYAGFSETMYNFAQNKASLETIKLEVVASPRCEGIILNDTTYVYENPTEDSEVMAVYRKNTTLSGYEYANNKDWYCVDLGESIGYIHSSRVGDSYIEETVYDLPYTAKNKTYMYGRSITCKSSNQYKLIQYAYVGKHGIYQIDGRYLIALGSYFDAEIGSYIDLILEDGTIIPCMLGDEKADRDTDSLNLVTTHSDCMSEFIVSEQLEYKAKRDGTLSSVEGWGAKVAQVVVYDKVYEY